MLGIAVRLFYWHGRAFVNQVTIASVWSPVMSVFWQPQLLKTCAYQIENGGGIDNRVLTQAPASGVRTSLCVRAM